MNGNAIPQKVTLDMKSNAMVTLDGNANHDLTRTNNEFLRQARKINEIEQRPFSFHDFKQLSKPNFRKKILENKQFIEIVHSGRPTFYKIKGVELPLDNHLVTLTPMGVGDRFIDILESLKVQTPSLHDIRVSFKSELHKHLVERGSSVNLSNHSIEVKFPCTDNNLTVKVLVYPTDTQIIIGCTYKPLAYNLKETLYLNEVLAQISYHLKAVSGYSSIPPVSEWLLTHYHFAKDGPEINGGIFHLTLEEVSGGLVRFYSKRMPNGMIIPRIEQVRTPQISMGEQLQQVLEV